MLSLCRLCAFSKEEIELKTQISDLETMLTFCCGWCPLENEFQMPSKACDSCVDQLQKSWAFAENIKDAETKLKKFVSELNLSEPVATTSHNTVTIAKEEPENPSNDRLEELENSLDFSETIIPIKYLATDYSSAEYSDAKSSHSSEERTSKTRATEKKKESDPFLAFLDDEDRLVDGSISVNGVLKLEQQFPEMKTMSWNECQYNCGKCDRLFNGPHNFFAHNRSMHIEEVRNMTFVCLYCKSKHRGEYNLSRHMAMKHFTHLKYRCFYCRDYFWDINELIKHRNMHTNIEYKCELCNQIFLSRKMLYSHILQSHQKKRWASDLESKFTCDICSKDFATKCSIKSHMMQHNKKFDYVCDQCGWKFLTKGNLKGHLETTHSNEKPFVCAQCNSRFKTKHQLSSHTKRHEKVKPLACNVCGKRFRETYGLTVHMRSHNNICPYTCKYCDRKFRHTSGLKTHERTHTSEKPYVCSHCDYRSTNWPNLNKHSMRIHSIDLRTKKT